MCDSRRNVEFLRSWTEQAGVDPQDYEVVVSINAEKRSAVEIFRSLARPHDRVLAVHGENEMHYYELGRREAGCCSSRKIMSAPIRTACVKC